MKGNCELHLSVITTTSRCSMFVFKVALLAVLALCAVGQLSCPNSQWTYDATSKMCYLVGKTSLYPFNYASSLCLQQGAKLATVHTPSVQTAITALGQNADSDFYYWIGLSLNQNGQFSWIDGTNLDYFRWCTGNPSTDATKTCGALDTKSNCWRNVNCNTNLPYICAYDPSVTTTTPRPLTTTASISCHADNYPQGQGAVYSPGYPGAYGNNEDCNYLLTAYTNGQVALNIISLYTEQCCDILTVYDGPTRFSPQISRLSGTLTNQYIYSTGQFMTLRFTSDTSVVAAGFSGTYSTVYRTSTTASYSTTSSFGK